MGPTLSNIYLETYINGEYTMILTKSFVYSFRPYVIQFYSLTNSQTLTILEINNKKILLTPEKLIGLTCGGAAIFFITLACIILYCRDLKERELNALDEFSISDEQPEIMENKDNNNNVIIIDKPINSNYNEAAFENHANINENNNDKGDLSDDSLAKYWF